MNPDLEQLADEAIEARAAAIEHALARHGVPRDDQTPSGIVHLDRSRAIVAGTWERLRPELARLANERLAAIAALAAKGIVPDFGCTVSAGRVTLEAVRDAYPVAHRYVVMRGRERAGCAWLSNAGWYTLALDVQPGLTFTGARVREVLSAAAGHLAEQPLAGAR